MCDPVVLAILDVEADLCCNVYLIWALRCFHFLPQNTRISICGLYIAHFLCQFECASMFDGACEVLWQADKQKAGTMLCAGWDRAADPKRGDGRCVWSEQGRGAIVQSRVEGNHLCELDVCHINLRGVQDLWNIPSGLSYPLTIIQWEHSEGLCRPGHTQNKNRNYFRNQKRPL